MEFYLNAFYFAAGQCFFPGTPVYSTNKTDRHDITEINTLTLTPVNKKL